MDAWLRSKPALPDTPLDSRVSPVCVLDARDANFSDSDATPPSATQHKPLRVRSFFSNSRQLSNALLKPGSSVSGHPANWRCTKRPEKLDRAESLFASKVLVSTELAAPPSVASSQPFKLEDHFIIEQIIGRSSASEVYRARHRVSGKVYAVKRGLHKFVTREQRDRRIHEIRAVSNLPHHPNVVGHYRGWQQGSHLYIQMDLCEGGSLGRLLRQVQKTNGSIVEHVLWRYLKETAEGLAFLHERNVLHLDIKPDNLYFAEGDMLRIGDFGLAYKAGEWEDWEEGDGNYLAPELLSSARPTTAADIYSLGATLYECATGNVLPKDLAMRGNLDLPGRSPELAQLIGQMVAADPTARPTAYEVARQAASTMSRCGVDATALETPVGRGIRPTLVWDSAATLQGADGGESDLCLRSPVCGGNLMTTKLRPLACSSPELGKRMLKRNSGLWGAHPDSMDCSPMAGAGSLGGALTRGLSFSSPGPIMPRDPNVSTPHLRARPLSADPSFALPYTPRKTRQLEESDLDSVRPFPALFASTDSFASPFPHSSHQPPQGGLPCPAPPQTLTESAAPAPNPTPPLRRGPSLDQMFPSPSGRIFPQGDADAQPQIAVRARRTGNALRRSAPACEASGKCAGVFRPLRRKPLISPFETAGGPPGFETAGGPQAENPRVPLPQGSGLRESAPDLGRSLEPMWVSAQMDDLTLGPANTMDGGRAGNPGSSHVSHGPIAHPAADSTEGCGGFRGPKESVTFSNPSLLHGGVTPWMGKKRSALGSARGSREMERDLSRGSLASPWLSWAPAWQQGSRGVDVP